jgi:hypothetical protein
MKVGKGEERESESQGRDVEVFITQKLAARSTDVAAIRLHVMRTEGRKKLCLLGRVAF